MTKTVEATRYYAYMLRCADGTLYSGYSTDPWQRLKVHNNGQGAKYTRSRLPVELVFWQSFAAKNEAMKREAALKKLSRADKLELIKKQAD